MPYMHVLYACLICMYALYACMPYMHVCLICMPYMRAFVYKDWQRVVQLLLARLFCRTHRALLPRAQGSFTSRTGRTVTLTWIFKYYE